MDILADKMIEWADLYERESFIPNDPISIPHSCSNSKDIEVSAFLTSWISYGNRKAIVAKANQLLEEMNHTPYKFIVNGCYSMWKNDTRSFYRFYKYRDLYDIANRLHGIYQKYDSLEDAIIDTNKDDYVASLQSLFANVEGIPSVDGGSACKRLCMFLRWMVRKDSSVDFGIWNRMDKSKLIIPLDVHVHNLALQLGLTSRKNADMKTARQITDYFSTIFVNDPARGDFALFGKDMEDSIKAKNQ